MNSFVEWQAPLLSNEPHPDSIVPVRVPLLKVNPQGGVGLHIPHIRDMSPHQTVQRDPLETASDGSSATDPRFFSPVQAHVAESVLSALVTTSTTSQSAKPPSSGTVQCPSLEKTSKGAWSQRTASCFASIGKSQRDADPQATQNDTDARDVEKPIMGPRVALKQRKLEPCTPYNKGTWAELLQDLGLWEKYPCLVQGFAIGFDLGIPHITHTHTPPNHSSVTPLFNVYSSIIDSEFAAGQYIGPFTRHQLELALGPFQTSPLSLVPKASKPGMYRAVHNFSHPHDASHNVSSINSHINCDDFPCTWGTFATVALLIAHLPPGSQASVRDMAEAYRTIPAIPSQWPGLVIHLQSEDQFAVNVCNNFGLTSAGGVYGMVADASTDIFRGQGMGPVTKWVDDHIFFRVPRTHLASYNAQHAEWHQEIHAHGGQRHEGSRLWYGGKGMPNRSMEEFDEDSSMTLLDLSGASPCSPADQQFVYAAADIDQLSSYLGISWQTSKSIPFGVEVPYLGFRWNLCSQVVYLPEEKKAKYLMAIAEWGKTRAHNLLKTQKLYGKLLHAALVIPAGHTHLTSLEAMLTSFKNNPFIPHPSPRYPRRP
jgi:hypothetical protein